VIVLASQSKARRALLAVAGVEAAIEPAALDEDEIKRRVRSEGGDTARCALTLAEAKAARVARNHADALVIGADQILDCGGAWFDKPRDLADAKAQLGTLRGRAHELVSAVAVARGEKYLWRHVEHARLLMRPFTDAFLDSYVAAMGERLTETVGGYALEGLGAQLFERVEGDYFAILGLPLLPLLAFLRDEGAVAR
jgi:septum formation protein